MTSTALVSPAERARRVIQLSAAAWRIAPASPRAIARRAPHAQVPARALRRLRAAAASLAGPPFLAHSW